MNKEFDAVFSNAVFHFIKDQDTLLNRISKVLKDNGYLICEFGAAGNIAEILNTIEKVMTLRNKPFVNRFFYPTEEEYNLLLRKHGFYPEEISVYDIETQLNGPSGLRDWIEQVFRVEMELFSLDEREEVLEVITESLKDTHYIDSGWVVPNRRIRIVAQKKM
jgi:trans-aconitate methyltransferase